MQEYKSIQSFNDGINPNIIKGLFEATAILHDEVLASV